MNQSEVRQSEAHQSEERLELYSLGRLSESCSAAVEEHLLVCAECQQKLDETEAFALAMRAGIAIEADAPVAIGWFGWLKAQALRLGEFGGLRPGGLRRLTPAFAGAFAAFACLAFLFLHSGGKLVAPVASVELTAMRGNMLSVPLARETDIVLADAPAGQPARCQVVDATGGLVWTGTLTDDNRKIHIAKQLPAGNYFVRLYDAAGQLLHEYGIRVGIG